MKGQPSSYHFPSSIFGPWKFYFLVPPIFAQCELFNLTAQIERLRDLET